VTEIAVAHHCEGAGHASRMLAVAEAIERTGHGVTTAGGGPGTPFLRANGYDPYEPPTVDFVEDYQRGGGLLAAVRHDGPAAVERVAAYRRWLDRVDPPVVVTDGIAAAAAAAVDGRRYVYLSHDPAALYDAPAERVGAWTRNRLTRETAERFFLPKAWPGPPTVPGTEVVPPIAPTRTGRSEATAGASAGASADTDADADVDVDVLLVPSAYGVASERVTDALERAGRSVTVVGGDEWTVQPSLQPYVADAALVVCSGYSTVMEAAVAGTPCVVVPTTSEQRGVAAAVARQEGFHLAHSAADVLAVHDDPGSPTPRDNGADRVAEAVSRLVPEP